MKAANLLDIVLSGVFATSQEIEQEIEDVSRGGEAENEALNTAEIEDGSSDNEADQDVDQEIENVDDGSIASNSGGNSAKNS